MTGFLSAIAARHILETMAEAEACLDEAAREAMRGASPSAEQIGRWARVSGKLLGWRRPLAEAAIRPVEVETAA